MAKYKITAPDGKQYIVSGGDVPPTQEQIRNLIAQQNTSTPDKKNLGDYFMDELANIGYGAKKALSGATLGASDWALRKLGLDNEQEYLARKEAEGLGTLTKGLGFASEIGGNIIGAGGKLLGALGKAGLKGLPLALATGGIEGGAYGLTSSDTLKETPENVLTGTIGGTIGGALGEGAGRLLSRGLRGATAMLSRNPNTASGSALSGLVDDVAENIGNRPQAEKLVNEALDKAQASGRSLIEVADDSIVDVAQKARQKTPEARYILSNKLNQAREAQPIELRNYINDILGTSSRGESVGEVTRLAQEKARPIYQKLDDIGDLAKYEVEGESNILTKYDNPLDYRKKENEYFEKANKQFLEDRKFDKNNKDLIEENTRKYVAEKEIARKQNIARMAQYAELAKNNPDAYYVRIGDVDKITPDDIYNGRIKGITNSKGVKYDTDEFYSKLGDSYSDVSNKSLKEEFSFKYPAQTNGERTKYEYVNPVVEDIKNGFLASKGYNTPYVPNFHQNYLNFDELERVWGRDIMTDKEPIMREIRNILKKDGWEPYHSSGKRVTSSSSYYENPQGETLRLSNHNLPDTAERRYNTDNGLRKGWDYEYVIDDPYTEMDYYLSPNADEFRKLFYYNSGIPMPGEPSSKLSSLIQNNNLIKDTIRQVKNSRSAIKDLPDTDFKVINDARSKLSEVTQGLDKTAAYDARQALKELDPVLDDIIPEYAQARSIYSNAHKFDNAAALSKDVFNSTNPADFKFAVQGLSQPEKDALAIGLRDDLLYKLGSRENQSLGFKGLMTQNVQDKMRYALGDDVANQIIQKAGEALDLNRNYNKLLQGSQTAEKQALRDKANVVMNILKNPTGVVGELLNPLSKTIQNRANTNLAKALTSNDIGSLRNGLNYYNSLRNAYNINPIYGISTGAQLGKYLAEEF